MDDDDAASIQTSVLSLRSTPSLLTISSMATTTTSSGEPPPYSMLDPHTTPEWASTDPRPSSRNSLRPSESAMNNMKGKRKLLLIYIHGFMGSETSFQSFPAHVHNLLSLLLAETHVVHTKIYPRYRPRNYLYVVTNDFSAWLKPHESPETDVILLGHSMGGLLSAEIVLLSGDDPASESLRHRILGTISFDAPFLGINPSIVKTGIKSLYQKSPNPASPQVAEPTEPQSTDPNFNPSFENDINLAFRSGWKNVRHFIHKHAKDLMSATDDLITSHIEFGGAMANYDSLKTRYSKIRLLEEEDEDKRKKVVSTSGHPPRVRFANYYTASTGPPKSWTQDTPRSSLDQRNPAAQGFQPNVPSASGRSLSGDTLTPPGSSRYREELDISDGDSEFSNLTDLDLDLSEEPPPPPPPEVTPHPVEFPPSQATGTEKQPVVVAVENAQFTSEQADPAEPSNPQVPRIITTPATNPIQASAPLVTPPAHSLASASTASSTSGANLPLVYEPPTNPSQYGSTYHLRKQLKAQKIAIAQAFHDLKEQQHRELDALREEVKLSPTNKQQMKDFLKLKKEERNTLIAQSKEQWTSIFRTHRENLEARRVEHLAESSASKAERERNWEQQKASKEREFELSKAEKEREWADTKREKQLEDQLLSREKQLEAQELTRERQREYRDLRKEWHDHHHGRLPRQVDSPTGASEDSSKQDWRAEWHRRKLEKKHEYEERKLEKKRAWEQKKMERKVQWDRKKMERKLEKLKDKEHRDQAKVERKLEEAERKMEKKMSWKTGEEPKPCGPRAMSVVASSLRTDSPLSGPGSSPSSTPPMSPGTPTSSTGPTPSLPPRPSLSLPPPPTYAKDKKFCVLPPKHASGMRDPTWIRVLMKDYDQVTAHCALFTPVGLGEEIPEGVQWGARYATLVGDVAERIETWIHEAMADSVRDGVRNM